MTSNGGSKNPGIMRTPLGEFQIGKTLGEGSYVKIIKRFVPADSKGAGGRGGKTFEQRILREANLTRFLNHESIVPLRDCRITKSHFYLFYECVSGCQLTDKISRNGLPLETVKGYFKQIVEAIGYCHAQFVVHRDIKVENIMVDNKDQIKIIDFGLANFFDQKNNLKTFCGSLQYSAPEIMRGDPYVGVVLFAMLTGTLPFDDPRSPGAWESIMNGKIKFPSNMSSGITHPSNCFYIVAKSLIIQCLDSNTKRRIKMPEIYKHQFLGANQVNTEFHINTKRIMPTKLDMEIVNEMTACLFQSEYSVLSKLETEIKTGTKVDDLTVRLNNSPMVSVYHLISNSKNKLKTPNKTETFSSSRNDSTTTKNSVPTKESADTSKDHEEEKKKLIAKRLNKYATVKDTNKSTTDSATSVKEKANTVNKRQSMFETYKKNTEMTKEELKKIYKEKRASIYDGLFTNNSDSDKYKLNRTINRRKTMMKKTESDPTDEQTKSKQEEVMKNKNIKDLSSPIVSIKSPFLKNASNLYEANSPIPKSRESTTPPLSDDLSSDELTTPTASERTDSKSAPNTTRHPRLNSSFKQSAQTCVDKSKKKVTFLEEQPFGDGKITKAMDIFTKLDQSENETSEEDAKPSEEVKVNKTEVKDDGFKEIKDYLKIDFMDGKIELGLGKPTPPPRTTHTKKSSPSLSEIIPGVRQLTVLECLKLNVIKISKKRIELLCEELLDLFEAQNIDFDWPDLKSIFVAKIKHPDFEELVEVKVELVMVSKARSSAIILVDVHHRKELLDKEVVEWSKNYLADLL